MRPRRPARRVPVSPLLNRPVPRGGPRHHVRCACHDDLVAPGAAVVAGRRRPPDLPHLPFAVGCDLDPGRRGRAQRQVVGAPPVDPGHGTSDRCSPGTRAPGTRQLSSLLGTLRELRNPGFSSFVSRQPSSTEVGGTRTDDGLLKIERNVARCLRDLQRPLDGTGRAKARANAAASLDSWISVSSSGTKRTAMCVRGCSERNFYCRACGRRSAGPGCCRCRVIRRVSVAGILPGPGRLPLGIRPATEWSVRQHRPPRRRP